MLINETKFHLDKIFASETCYFSVDNNLKNFCSRKK